MSFCRKGSCARLAVPALVLFALFAAAALVTHARAETPVQIAVGSTAACALTDDGDITCWGFDNPLVRDVPQGNFTDLSLGPTDACAITVDSTVVCWGAGYAHLRDSIETVLARNPQADLHLAGLAQLRPPDRTDLVQVAVHPWRHYACARSSQGEIACWGLPLPRSPAPDSAGFVQLISTGREFCALDGEGRTTCWGDLTTDQFISDAGPFNQLVASGNGLCGLTPQGDVRCRTFRARTAPGPPQPYTQLFRNVHLLGSQGCAIVEDGSIQCSQTLHWCYHVIAPQLDHCPALLIRFQYWPIDFNILFEGGPDRDATAAHSYTRLFGDQAACAITTESHILCWSDFRSDPRHHVPERFRPPPPLDDPAAPAEQEQ